MKTLAEKVKALLPMLEERGTVYLFALFERTETAGKWDIVLSSEWSDDESTPAVQLISDALISKLNAEELSALSRVFIARSNEPEVECFAIGDQGMPMKHFVSDDFTFMGVPIKQAYVFRTRVKRHLDVAV